MKKEAYRLKKELLSRNRVCSRALWRREFLLTTLLLLLGGCDTLSFYNQAIWGQMELLVAREDLATLIEDSATSIELRNRLVVAQAILNYADDEIGLSVDNRYQSYVELGRPYVVWNVVAATQYSVVPKEWCFLIVGCVPYRGYFGETDASNAAAQLTAAGFETYVGGVPAYSTLDWFDDPLMSSFINMPDLNLANLLFHELAHSKIWIEDDVTFNENFAGFVGDAAAQAWAQASGRDDEYRDWHENRQDWTRFKGFMMSAKQYLADGFEAQAESTQASFKATAMQTIVQCYDDNRGRLGRGRFDGLVYGKLNNAYLASLGTYEDLQGAFRALFQSHHEDWAAFFSAVETLANLDGEPRSSRLNELIEQDRAMLEARLAEDEIGDRADDDNAGEVDCDAFTGHRLNGKAAR